MSFWSTVFSSSHTITVSSAVYNLAGDGVRPNFLKTTIVGALLSPNNTSLGEQITNTYLAGPGIQLRGFARWSQNYGYSSLIGLAATQLNLISPVALTSLAPLLPSSAGATTVVQNARIGAADYVFWVLQYMTQNYPTLLNTNYVSDFDGTTNTVTIYFTSGSTATFTIPGFNPSAQYLYVTYEYTTVGPPPTTSALQYMAYQQNTGNASFDALFTIPSNLGYFFPYIPLRANKIMVSPSTFPDIYTQSVKALKKATGASYDTIINKLNANSSISKIDYAYIVFGVSLNTTENACRSYIYQFFLQVTASLGSTPTVYGYSVSTLSAGAAIMNYNMTIYWDSLTEAFGNGVLTNGTQPAKAGDFWFVTIDSGTYNADTGTTTPTIVRLNWQETANTWRYIDIVNLMHTNLIYKGNAVNTYATDALAATAESPFIIPLNEGIFATTPLINATQMATACCFLVYNSYVITSTPWYASSWFKVILFVAVIAISALTADPATLGLLGSNLAVGTALGFTVASAAIAGAVVNTIAAIVLISVIQSGATLLFGSQMGAIIGAIVGLAMLQVGTAFMNGAPASALLNTITQPMNLLKLSESAGNGYAQFINAGTQKTENSTTAMLASYNAADDALKAQEKATFGPGSPVDLSLNPLSLIDTSFTDISKKFVQENRDDFLTRTLMSGSEISQISMDYVNNFCEATLSVILRQT